MNGIRLILLLLSASSFLAAHEQHIAGSHAQAATSKSLMQHAAATPEFSFYIPRQRSVMGRKKLKEHTKAERAARIATRTIKSTSKPSRHSPHKIGMRFTAATNADTDAVPPSGSLAVGTEQLLVALDGRIRTLSKNTGKQDNVIDMTTNMFFAPVRGEEATTDPRVIFDAAAKTWYVIAITMDVPGYIYIATAHGDVITEATAWSFFRFLQTPEQTEHQKNNEDDEFNGYVELIDYPTVASIGGKQGVVIITANRFKGNEYVGKVYQGSVAYVIKKQTLGIHSQIQVTKCITGTKQQGVYCPQVAQDSNQHASSAYIVGTDVKNQGVLAIARLDNIQHAPKLKKTTYLVVPTTNEPVQVDHKGNNDKEEGKLNALDSRITCAVVNNGSLWTVQTVGVDKAGVSSAQATRNGCRWYQLGLKGKEAYLIQAGTLVDQSPKSVSYFMPSLAVNGQGHMILGASSAGKHQYISATFASRLHEDPAGTLRPAHHFTEAKNAYNPDFDWGGKDGRRWGDYSATVVDPTDNQTIWTMQQFANGKDSFGLRVGKIMAPVPAKPLRTIPSLIPVGKKNVSVTIEGVSRNGSAYYNPGSGFKHKLEVAIVGVKVNKITKSDATSITLSVDTRTAKAGARTVVIKNPDGQLAVGKGVIRLKK